MDMEVREVVRGDGHGTTRVWVGAPPKGSQNREATSDGEIAGQPLRWMGDRTTARVRGSRRHRHRERWSSMRSSAAGSRSATSSGASRSSSRTRRRPSNCGGRCPRPVRPVPGRAADRRRRRAPRSRARSRFSGTRSCALPDARALAAAVTDTVYHEIAHHFGISDARLHELQGDLPGRARLSRIRRDRDHPRPPRRTRLPPPLEPDDVELVHRWYEDTRVQTLMGDLPLSLAARRRATRRGQGRRRDVYRFVICRLEDDTPVGRTDLFDIDRDERLAARFGITIGDPALWGQGYGPTPSTRSSTSRSGSSGWSASGWTPTRPTSAPRPPKQGRVRARGRGSATPGSRTAGGATTSGWRCSREWMGRVPRKQELGAAARRDRRRPRASAAEEALRPPARSAPPTARTARRTGAARRRPRGTDRSPPRARCRRCRRRRSRGRRGQPGHDRVVRDDPVVLLARVAVVGAGRRDRVVGDRDGHDPIAPAGRPSSASRMSRRWPRSGRAGTPWTTSLTPISTVTNSGGERVQRGQLVADQVGATCSR